VAAAAAAGEPPAQPQTLAERMAAAVKAKAADKKRGARKKDPSLGAEGQSYLRMMNEFKSVDKNADGTGGQWLVR
jgi:hypothetical protein